MRKLTVEVTTEQWDALDRMAGAQGVPKQELIAEALRLYTGNSSGYSIPLKGGGSYTLTGEQVRELCVTFPGVHIDHELKNLCLWNEQNPRKRKTLGGVKRHIQSWLNRAAERRLGRQGAIDKWLEGQA